MESYDKLQRFCNGFLAQTSVPNFLDKSIRDGENKLVESNIISKYPMYIGLKRNKNKKHTKIYSLINFCLTIYNDASKIQSARLIFVYIRKSSRILSFYPMYIALHC